MQLRYKIVTTDLMGNVLPCNPINQKEEDQQNQNNTIRRLRVFDSITEDTVRHLNDSDVRNNGLSVRSSNESSDESTDLVILDDDTMKNPFIFIKFHKIYYGTNRFENLGHYTFQGFFTDYKSLPQKGRVRTCYNSSTSHTVGEDPEMWHEDVVYGYEFATKKIYKNLGYANKGFGGYYRFHYIGADDVEPEVLSFPFTDMTKEEHAENLARYIRNKELIQEEASLKTHKQINQYIQKLDEKKRSLKRKLSDEITDMQLAVRRMQTKKQKLTDERKKKK